MALDDINTIVEVARHLKIEKKTVKNYIEMGKLHCVRLGVSEYEDPKLPDSRHPIRITKEQVQQFIIKGMTNKISPIQLENAERIDERLKEGYLPEEVKIPVVNTKK